MDLSPSEGLFGKVEKNRWENLVHLPVFTDYDKCYLCDNSIVLKFLGFVRLTHKNEIIVPS